MSPKHGWDDCGECRAELARFEELGDRLEKEMTSGSKYDVLGEYRLWADRNNVPFEDESGWGVEGVFDEANITAFIKHWNKQYEE